MTWEVAGAASDRPLKEPVTPYGPYPCKAINKILIRTSIDGEEVTIYAGKCFRRSTISLKEIINNMIGFHQQSCNGKIIEKDIYLVSLLLSMRHVGSIFVCFDAIGIINWLVNHNIILYKFRWHAQSFIF